MKLISVRALSILLSLVLVAATAAICISLAVTTGDEAIRRTKDNGDKGIQGAFTTAAENVNDLSNRLMNSILKTATLYMTDFMAVQTNVVSTMRDFWTDYANTPSPTAGLRIFEWNTILEYQRRQVSELRNLPAVGIVFTTVLGQFNILVKTLSTLTMTNYSEYYFMMNNGSDLAMPYDQKWTIGGLVDNQMNFLNKNYTCNGLCPYMNTPDNYARCPATIEGVCPVTSWSYYDPLNQTYIPLGLGVVPEGKLGWTPIVDLSNYVGAMVVAPISSKYVPKSPITGQKVALVCVGVDLRYISTFLSMMTLPEGGRVFAATAVNDPIIPYPTLGALAGASHGGFYTQYYDAVRQYTIHNPINCTMSSDPVINQTCQWIYDTFPVNAFMDMASNTTYTPVLNGETFYVKSSILSDGNGLVWALVIAVPRSTIMGKIDAAQAETAATIQQQSDDTRKDKEYKYMVMYIVLSVSAAALIVLSVVFTIAITSPMITLQDEMAAVACMELEAVNMERPTSGLEEVGSMQVSFLQMCRNLREYRNYMPASILSSNDDEEEEEAVETRAADEDADVPVKRGQEERSEATGGELQRGSKMASTRGSSKSSNSKMQMKKNAVSSMEVKKKRVSLLVVNIQGWHRIVDSNSSNDTSFIHSAYVQLVLEAVNANKGTADVFLGDRFIASWNTVKNLGTHRSSACHTALKAVKGVKELTTAGVSHDFPALSLSAAVSCGEARCGNMGCDGMKKYTFVGPVASMVHILERRNKKYGTNILIDGAVEEEAKNVFFVRKVDHVLVPRLQERAFKLFELVSTKAVSEDEWMYQLQEGEHGDPYAVFTSSVDLYLKGNMEDAITALEKCSAKDDQYTRFRALLENTRGTNGTVPALEKLEYV